MNKLSIFRIPLLIHLYRHIMLREGNKMSVELIKKSLVLNKATNRESIQVIKERDLIVPDGKPDMKKILQMDGKIEVEQMEVQQDRILYKGKIECIILYVPENNPMAICIMKGTIPLEDFIIMEGVNKEHAVKLNYSIEHLHWNVLNERKVNVKAIIEFEVNATESQVADITIDWDSNYPIQTKKDEIYFCNKGNVKEERMIIKDDLTVPVGKPNIGEILKVDIKIINEEFKRTEEEIFYSGNLDISTLYKAQNDDEALEVMYHQIPFSNAIEYVREDEEESYDCKLDIRQQYTQVIPDLDGEDRILELEVIVKVEASNICSINEEIIEDIYCPGKRVILTDATNDFINLLHKTNLCVPKKETIKFEEMAPDNEIIYSVCMKPVVEEISMSENRLEVSGTIEVAIIYLSQDATPRLASTSSVIPFVQEVEIQGANNQSTPRVEVKVSDIRILTQGKREVAVEFKLCSMIEIYNKQPLYMLQDIEINDLDEEEVKKFPSMIIYTVKPGDSYWSIAKKYNTTLEEIGNLNEIDINEEIMPNQKIMILKKST